MNKKPEAQTLWNQVFNSLALILLLQLIGNQ